MTATISTPALLLAAAADNNGLWARDAARFDDIRVQYGLTLEQLTPDVIEEAHMIDRGSLRKLLASYDTGRRVDLPITLTPEALRAAMLSKEVKETLDGRKNPKRKKLGKKRTTVFGYSVTAVLRWMGKQGDWTFDDAALAVETLAGTRISDVTVRLQMKAGKDGLRGEPAKIDSKQAKKLREAAK